MEKIVVAAMVLAISLAGFALVQYPPLGYSALYVNNAPGFSVTVENYWPHDVGYALSVTTGGSTARNNFSLPPGGNATYSYAPSSGTAVLSDEYGREYIVQRG